MKLRKKDFEVPKNFSVSPWTFQDLYGGISRFSSPPDFFPPKSHFALPKNQKNIHEDIEHISVDIGFYRDRVSALVACSANFDGAQGAHRIEYGEDCDAYVSEDGHPHGGYAEQG